MTPRVIVFWLPSHFASAELSDSHYIELFKNCLSYVIELNHFVSIRFLSRVHLQKYVLWYTGFICQNYIDLKKKLKGITFYLT